MLQALTRFQDLGGQVVRGMAFAIEGLSENLDWFHAAASAVNVNGTMGNSAYNPGTFGAAKGKPAIDGFVERLRTRFLPSLALSLDHIVSLWDASPWTSTSQAMLSYWQSLAGFFVGYQIALDTAFVSRGWFDETLVVFNGPGVPAQIKRIFTLRPWLGTGLTTARRQGSTTCYKTWSSSVPARLMESRFIEVFRCHDTM
jgi:hypothetical protein